MECPACGKDLEEPTKVDMNRVGWSCVSCGIKIYQEKEKYKGVARCDRCKKEFPVEMLNDGYCPDCFRWWQRQWRKQIAER